MRPSSPIPQARTAAGLLRETLRAGTLAGLAMIPFAAVFRARGLRINEYGRKTLDLVTGGVEPGLHGVLTFVQHILISWVVALPFLIACTGLQARRARVLAGTAYGVSFYVAVNSLALPYAFGDPTPWQLGFAVVYPSLVIHIVYGAVLALASGAGVRLGADADGGRF